MSGISKGLLLKSSALISAAFFASAAPFSAAAQGDTIIVTATKRAENIQDVPISISAYGDEFIDKSGVQELRDIALYSPNFTIGSSSQLSNNRIAIRGVGSVGNAGIEPSVGVFIDGIYYPRPGSVIGNLMDLQAVEVLRGPQGTLFGRNTPMGALNVRTKDPLVGEFEGRLHAGYGSHDRFDVGGAINIPLGQNAAARFSGKYTDRDGYGTNLLNGMEFGERDDLNLRGKLLFEPSDNFSIKITGDYGKINSGGQTIEFLNSTTNPVFLGTLQALAGPSAGMLQTADSFDHDIFQDHRDNLDDEQWGIAGEIVYEMASGHEIKSITGVRGWDANYFESAIRLPIQLFPRKTTYDNDTFSQEIQFLSPTGGAFDYLFGAFYYNEDYFISQDFDLGAQFCIPVVAGLAGLPAAMGCAMGQQIDASDSDFTQDLESIAVFGQASWHVTDALSLTFGGRYTDDSKTGDFMNVVNNPFVIALSVRDNETQLGLNIDEFGFSTSKFTYFGNVSYNVNDDVMLFATTSTGYKSGGFNTDGTFPALTRMQRIFGPEDTTNYEIGIKSTFADGAILFNLTAYRMDIEGFQDRAFDGISFITRNVGELRQQGIEADVALNPFDQLSIMGGFSYLDSEFIDYQNASPLPGGPVQDLSGQRAHFSPEYQGSIVADWSDDFRGAFGGIGYFLRGEMQHVGTQNIGGNTNQNPQSIQEAYTILNARVGLRSPDDNWELAVWGKNLTDKGYCTVIFDQPFGAQLGGLDPVANTIPQRCAVGTPLTWGVEVKARF